MKLRKSFSFLFLVVLLTAVVFSCDESLPEAIYGTKPVAAFTATQSQSDIYTWSFTNSSTGAVSYNWDFGDGNGSSEANPSHTYTGAGQFAVTLTATAAGTSNSMGWRNTNTQSVQIDLPTYETAHVLFKVDMSNETLSATDKVYLSGSFGGTPLDQEWSGNGTEMLDGDGDGVYVATVELTTNKLYEYKFTMNNWAAQEQFDANDACAYQAPGSSFWNRSLELGNLEKTVELDNYCFNTCSATCLTCVADETSSSTVGSIKLTSATDKNWKDGGDIWEAFGNVLSDQVDNPDLGEGNMSCKVNKLWDDNDSCEGWAGWAHRFGENCNDPGPVCADNRLNFSTATKKKFKLKVHGPENAVIIMKFEFNPYPNTSPTVERKIILSADQANKWTELVFDFSDETGDQGVANALIYTYHQDDGGSPCGGQVIYVDDFEQVE